MATVQLVKVNKVYDGGVHAVHDFSIDIADKEFIVFVGPSGCGKSTTLRMIAGLEEISFGDLLIDGKIMNSAAPKDRDIAMVFQSYALYPQMTVYNNMAYALKLRKIPKDEIDRRVKEAAKILKLTPYLDRKPRALSGGQRQRVALGRSIVRRPKVFLMDEPLSNLDAKMRTQMRTEIIKLHKELQTTFVYVTHDQTEAMTMGTRIVVMKDGLIQQVDTPDNLYEFPVNKFVAGFIGAPQMNFIDVMLSQEDGEESLYAKFGRNSLLIDKSTQKRITGEEVNQRQFVLGVRAEDVYIVTESDKKFKDSTVKATVKVTEKLGNETLVYCAVDGAAGDVIVRAGARCNVLSGDEVLIGFDTKHIQLFDYDTELNVLKR